MGRTRKYWMVLPALFVTCGVHAQVLDIISIIDGAIKKAIVAADLKVQQLQTQTIGLQNEQKALENDMDQSELSDIAGWVQQQKALFSEYYQELWEVKNVLSTYEQVEAMINRQAQIVAGYQQAYSVLGRDKHFTASEVSHMYAVLSGIVSQSTQNFQRLTMVVTSLQTQMDDASRLRTINQTGTDIDRNYQDMAQFSQESFLLSMQRAQDAEDVAATEALYGVQQEQ